MSDGRRVPQPTELIYVPSPSWAPVLLAAGIGIVAIGLFAGLIYSVAGALIALPAVWSWIRDGARQFERLPREQRVSTAVLPAVPLRRPDPE